jgi:hypothetical protein
MRDGTSCAALNYDPTLCPVLSCGGITLPEEWIFAQDDPSEQLCKLHHFAMRKRQPEGDVDFIITVREYVNPPDPVMRYVAQTDKQTNQKTAPFTPTGWGSTLEIALVECLKAIRLFPYER